MRPVGVAFGKGFIFVVCLSAMTMQMNGVCSAAMLQVPAVASSQRGLSWTADLIVKRQQQNDAVTSAVNSEEEKTTNPEGNNSNGALSVLSYWYVLLVVVIVVVVAVVCFCACFVKKKRQSHQTLRIETRSYHSPAGSNLSPRQLSSIDERRSAIPQQTSSSFLDPTSSPGSLSIDATPIPSPQPSFTSSQRSARSSGRGSSRKRRRNHSPGHMSSGSEDTIKPNTSRSALSLGSTASSSRSLGHMGMPQVIRTESQSSGERSVRSAPSSHGRTHRRTTSSTAVRITPVGGVADSTSLRSASSMASMASVGSNHSSRSNRSSASNRSGVLMRSRSTSSPNTLVEVDVKVHLYNEEEREARSEIAAALAESARQLAQSAANFDQEEEEEERQRRGWHSKSLPHNSHSSSLPYRTSLGTTHSLPLHSNKRKLFSSYSSSNLPPYNRELAHTPNLPSSGHHTPPTASLDRPRHMVCADHPAYHAYENYRRNSAGHHRAPPPESPLTVRQQNSRLSSPSQRSLSSNSEYTPSHYHNVSLPPVHLRTHRLLSRRVSEPGVVSEGMGGAYQNHNPAFLGHIHSTRLGGVNSSPLSVASLDFHSPKSQSQKSQVPRLNGMTYPVFGNHELHEDGSYRLESLEVGGMRNENGSDSNTSTLCGSSHSSTLDNKNRLSRVSEKSEHNENDVEQKNDREGGNNQGLSSDEEELDHHEQTAIDVDLNPSVVPNQRGYPPDRDKRSLTLPNHYRKVTIQQPSAIVNTPTTEKGRDHSQTGDGGRVDYIWSPPPSPSSSTDIPLSSVNHSPPPRKPKHRPLAQTFSDSDALKEDKDTTSIGSTLPRSPTSSTCLSSQSVQSIQSVREETTLNDETRSRLARQASLPDVTQHNQASSNPLSSSAALSASNASPPRSSDPPSTQSLPRNGSRHPSSNDPLITTTSTTSTTNYAVATGSRNGVVENKEENVSSKSQTQDPPLPPLPLPPHVARTNNDNNNDWTLGQRQSIVEGSNHHHLDGGSQLSYPLQKMLSQPPVGYDIDSDDVDDEVLDSPPHRGSAHFHRHGNIMYHDPREPQVVGYQRHNSRTGGGITVYAGSVAEPPPQPQPSSNLRSLSPRSLAHTGFRGVAHGSLDHIRSLPRHHYNHNSIITSFNPGLGRSPRISPGLPAIVTAPPPLGSITVDIDV